MNSSNLVRINFNASLTDDETLNFTRSNPEGAFCRILSRLVLPESSKQFPQVVKMFVFSFGFGNHVSVAAGKIQSRRHLLFVPKEQRNNDKT